MNIIKKLVLGSALVLGTTTVSTALDEIAVPFLNYNTAGTSVQVTTTTVDVKVEFINILAPGGAPYDSQEFTNVVPNSYGVVSVNFRGTPPAEGTETPYEGFNIANIKTANTNYMFRISTKAANTTDAYKVVSYVSVFDQVLRNMASVGNAAEGAEVTDGSVTPAKIAPAENPGEVLLTVPGATEGDPNVVAWGKITNANISEADADRIAGSKITPNFGAQNVVTTGAVTAGNGLTVTGTVTLPAGSIENADLATGIAPSKIKQGGAGQVLMSGNTVSEWKNLGVTDIAKPTVDNSVFLGNTAGNSWGQITSAYITDATITNADIAATGEGYNGIDVAKIKLVGALNTEDQVTEVNGVYLVQDNDGKATGAFAQITDAYVAPKADTYAGISSQKINFGDGISQAVIFGNAGAENFVKIDPFNAADGGEDHIPIFSVLKSTQLKSGPVAQIEATFTENPELDSGDSQVGLGVTSEFSEVQTVSILGYKANGFNNGNPTALYLVSEADAIYVEEGKSTLQETVTGATTLASADVTGAATVGGTLGVTENATFKKDVSAKNVTATDKLIGANLAIGTLGTAEVLADDKGIKVTKDGVIMGMGVNSTNKLVGITNGATAPTAGVIQNATTYTNPTLFTTDGATIKFTADKDGNVSAVNVTATDRLIGANLEIGTLGTAKVRADKNGIKYVGTTAEVGMGTFNANDVLVITNGATAPTAGVIQIADNNPMLFTSPNGTTMNFTADKFGNVVAKGTLGVTGNTTIGTPLSSANLVVNGNLTVTGKSTLKATTFTTGDPGNLVQNGTLSASFYVTGGGNVVLPPGTDGQIVYLHASAAGTVYLDEANGEVTQAMQLNQTMAFIYLTDRWYKLD